MLPDQLPILELEGFSFNRIHTAAHLLEIAEIYIESFPEYERRPMRFMLQAIARDNAHFWRICQERETVGLLNYWSLTNTIYGEHFAIKPKVRNQGVGSKILRTLKQTLQQPILIEVDPPTRELEKRRIAFYEREGFSIIDTNYMQPSYNPQLPEVPLYLMSTDATLVGKRLKDTIKELYQVVFVRYEKKRI